VRRTFPSGGTQLLRISAGEVVGVIYSFIRRGKVYFYQSGLRYTDDKRLSPGMVANAGAINHFLAAGCREYDFLAGNAQYKKSLSTHSRELDWLVLQRPGWKLRTIALLRKLKMKARQLRAARPK
jgi:CelD/BcsL family acetyltransferase involved in cellulose biosynthesis